MLALLLLAVRKRNGADVLSQQREMSECYTERKDVVETSTGIVTHLSQENQIKVLGVCVKFLLNLEM